MSGASGERAPLRAADWRFFLPHPEGGRFRHLVLLGGSPALAARVADLALACRVSDTTPDDRSADAVVVLHGAAPAPHDVARCLVPGGSVYWEIDRRSLRHLFSTPARLRARFAAAGMTVTGTYAVGPNVRKPRVYVPLEVSGAFRWYMSTLYNPWTRSLAIVESVLRAVTGLDPHRFAPFAADLAITAVAHTGVAPRSLLDEVMTASALHEPLRPILLTSTHYETLSQRIVLLPFTRDGAQPVAVVKVSKSAVMNRTVETEQALLARIRRRLDANLRSTIPEPLGVGRRGDLTVATEAYMPGESLQRASCRWERPLDAKLDDLRLAAIWLAEFHRQTTSARPPWDAEQQARWVTGPAERYRSTFGDTDAERRLFAAAERYGATVAGTPLPVVLRKPDFFCSNVVRSGDSLAVVDWESSYAGPALCDLLRFVVPWSDVVSRIRGPRSFENFRRVFFVGDRTDPVVRGVHRAIDEYMMRLGMDRSLFPLLLLHTWLERALHHVDKQRLQGDVPRDARAGNRHIGRIAALAEYSERLFDTPRASAAPTRSTTSALGAP